ncbi:replication/maintenance protein RepL (plasmid) [Erwinia tracheiphila]|uniref:replication/maintenance protein RepL n=1 Tax=Erwinia tracheiphila TaxID=65700 RepID=UPI001F25CECB|nr:replication/maintenance protein RepL [Erwinia tracheiphila]UIA94521.1 replication/maintenance protein RepL [Erwinia tracheiphila]
MKSTRKKVKVIGKRSYIDSETGECKDFQVIDIEERDANFHKFWMFNIVQSLDLIGNQKMKVAFWLIENMNSENQIVFTQRQMAEKIDVSLDTVRKTITSLLDSGFLAKQNMGVYVVNPDCIFKGGKGQRLNVLYQYSELKK